MPPLTVELAIGANQTGGAPLRSHKVEENRYQFCTPSGVVARAGEPRSTGNWRCYLTVNGVSDQPQLVHHPLKAVQGEALLAVAECQLRVVVNLNDDPIRSGCHRSSGQVRH